MTLYLITAGRTSDGRYPVALYRTREEALGGVRTELEHLAHCYGTPSELHPLDRLDFGLNYFFWGGLSAFITLMEVVGG